MPIVKEYRFVMPMTVDEYHIGQLYACMHASAAETGTDTGVEIVENRPFTDEMGMASGQYSYKIYHIADRLPRILRALGPKSMMLVEERAWSAYPNIYMVITNPFLGTRLEITVRSAHLADRGTTENVFELSPEELAARRVVHLDIARDRIDDDHTKDAHLYDPATFRSAKTGRGPLVGDWTATCEPHMCAYRLVSVKCSIFGIQTRVERLLDSVQHGLYLRFHKQIFTLIDEWYGMDMDAIRREEDRLKAVLDAKLDGMQLATRPSCAPSDGASMATVASAAAPRPMPQSAAIDAPKTSVAPAEDNPLSNAMSNVRDDRAAH